MIVNGNLKFHTLGSGQLENAILERVAGSVGGTTLPTGAAGRICYNTDDNIYYFHNGTAWVAFATGGNAANLQNEVDNIESAIGSAVTTNGVYDGSAFTSATYISGATSLTDALMLLDSSLNANNTLAELDDVSLTAAATGDVLRYNGTAWADAALTLGLLNNVADGVDAAPTGDILAFDGTEWTAITPATFAADIDLTDLGDVTLTTPAAGDVLYMNGAGQWVNAAPGATSGVQPYDAGLASLATGGTGIVVMDGNTTAYRTLTAPAAGITITNANGVSGNPTFALANDLAALEGLATTGYVIRTGDGTAVTRSIDGTTDRIVVTNGDAVGSNTNIDLATVTQGSTGSFVKVTLDSYGRVTGNTAVVAADITSLVDATYVNIGGDTMTGNLTMSSGATVTGLPAPSASTDAVNKAYVDQIAEGMQAKPAAEVIVTASADITAVFGAAVEGTNFIYNNGTSGVGATITQGGAGTAFPTVDGVTLTSTTMGENGVVVAFPNNTANAVYNGRYNLTTAGSTGTPWVLTRCALCDEGDEIPGSYVFIKQGTNYAGTGWVSTDYNAAPLAVGTDRIWWNQFSGAGTYQAGTGLTLSGTTFNIGLGAGIQELPTDEVGIDLYSTSAGAIVLTTDGTTRSTATGAKLHLLLPAGSGLTQDGTGLYIAAGAITNTMLANSTIGINADAGGTDPVSLGETILFAGTSTQGISTTTSNNTVTITAANASSSQKGVATFDTADFAVTAGNVTIKAGGVDNAQLANNTITLSDGTNTDAVALGETLTVNDDAYITATVGANSLSLTWASTIDGLSNVSGADTAATGDLLTKTSGDWQPVTRSDLFGGQTINSLSDVNATHADGAVLTSTGTEWVAQKIYFLYDGASATSHTVTHNLGVKYCNVTVVDASNDEVIIPQSITFTSTSALTVTFNTAVACKVIVMGVA